MAENKKRIENGAAASPSGASVSRRATFQLTLRRVIDLAHAVLLEQNGNLTAQAPVDVPGAARAVKESTASEQLLKQALDGLEPEALIKLRTLMVAGRDGAGSPPFTSK